MTIRHGERHDGDGLTYRAIRHIQAKPASDLPGLLCLDAVSDLGVISTYYLWVSSDGDLRIHTSLPTNQDADGSAVGATAGTSADKLNDGFTLEGGTYDPATTITTQTTSAAALTIPDLGGTAQQWVFTKVAQTLENKTISAASNTISALNGDEMEAIAATHATYGVPITLVVVNGGSATLSVFNANAPFKFRVLDAHAINTKASNNGSWKIDNGTNDITTAVSYGATDAALTRAASINDAYHAISANGSLRVINTDAADTAILYVTILRVT